MMRLAAALAKGATGRGAKPEGDTAFADAAREAYEMAKAEDVKGYTAALKGAIEIALSDESRD